MKLFYGVIFVVLVLFAIIFIRYAIRKAIDIKYFNKILEKYSELYFTLEESLKQDYNVNEILRFSNLESNIIQFDLIDPLTFQDSKSLRRCMLKVGEFIIKYSETLKEFYDYDYETEEYTTVIEQLKQIRIICLGKNENTVIK